MNFFIKTNYPKALALYAGSKALTHLRERGGVQPEAIGVVAGAAGGPKGLILGALDRFVFGSWLRTSGHPVHLVGASIGAWRMATACFDDPVAGFERLAHDYVAQHYEPAPGQSKVTPTQISQVFETALQAMILPQQDAILHHPRYRLHVVTSRGEGWLAHQASWGVGVGFGMAWLRNAVSRRWLGLERVIFGTHPVCPMKDHDYPTRYLRLDQTNFMEALLASCSIPLALLPVRNIPSAPNGAYWDGGITDYHLHLRYQPPKNHPLVLYPHFQRHLVPGWLDKVWSSRHLATSALDSVLVLAPRPEWVATLPNGKLPDRQDFKQYANAPAQRQAIWLQAMQQAEQLADEWHEWLESPELSQVQPL